MTKQSLSLEEFLAECEKHTYGIEGDKDVIRLLALIRELKAQRDSHFGYHPTHLDRFEISQQRRAENNAALLKIINVSGE